MQSHIEPLLSTIIGDEHQKYLLPLMAFPSLRLFASSSFANLTGLGFPRPMIERILAAVELGKQAAWESFSTIKFRKAADVYAAYGPMLSGLTHEEFWVIPFNNQNELVGASPFRVAQGTINETSVSTREIFQGLLALPNVAGFIAMHNHPSGDPTASPEDRSLTQNIMKAGMIMNVPLIDHVIIGDQGRYYSFAESRSL